METKQSDLGDCDDKIYQVVTSVPKSAEFRYSYLGWSYYETKAGKLLAMENRYEKVGR